MGRSMSGSTKNILAVALLCFPGVLLAQTKTYTVTEFTVPAKAFVQGGNNKGQYVGGNIQVPQSAYLWPVLSAPTTLNLLSGFNGAQADAINDVGQVVGSSFSPALHSHATLWQGSSVQDLGVPPGDQTSQAAAINNAGVVVGIAVSATQVDITGAALEHAEVFDSGTFINLGTPGNFSSASGINNSGQIVGLSNLTGSNSFHAMLWNGTVATDLGTLGGPTSVANAINDSGEIAGAADLSGTTDTITVQHAALWKDGVVTDLGVLGGAVSLAVAINAGGDIVGQSTVSSTLSTPSHAVLWSKGQIIDLNSVIPASLQSQVTLEIAQAIADDGTILVHDTGIRTFLLTPVAPLAVGCPLPTAQSGIAYSSAAVASGGVSPYIFAVTGALPPGFSLASHTGVIAGTPTISGTFNFSIQATDSSSTPSTVTHACAISVAPKPDFSLTATPGALSLAPGASASTTVAISATQGFTGKVALQVSGLPTGASFSLQPASISGTQMSALQVNAGSAALGTYTIVLTGTSAGLIHTINIALTIADKSNLTVSPASLSFGEVHRFAVKLKELSVTNHGSSTASIERPTIEGGKEARDSFFAASACGPSLQPGHSCRIEVAFFAQHLGHSAATVEIPVKDSKPLVVQLSADVVELRR
jgi:probable HAF family extracellular repeat protein